MPFRFADNKRFPLWACGLALLATFTAGALFSQVWLRNTPLLFQTATPSPERRESGYTFINPLLECEYFDNQGSTQLRDMKANVEKVVGKKNDQVISVYYRDLLNGPWYGYHEDEPFSPQSLLKIPVVIAYMKLAENDPALLTRTITYQEPIETNLLSEENLVLGQEYPIQTLIERALKLSDNIAFNLLVQNIPNKYLVKVHQDLNITYPSEATPEDFVSVRSYSSIFRILYNASYLSREHSEYLLDVLADTMFDEGLTAGVPSNTLVSHKFGLKNGDQHSPEYQLHDCGIVYHPHRPYLLCVMTKGNNPQALKQTLKEISQTLYDTVTASQ